MGVVVMEIRTLGPGELIEEPGFYQISLERHHNQPCAGVSVTSGILRKMDLETPADVWAFHALNPDRWGRDETDALRLGAAMAYLVEGGKDALLEAFAVHPEDKPRKPTAAQVLAYDEGRASEAAVASVEYWREVEDSPSRWLTAPEFDLLMTMRSVLQDDPAALAVMGGVPEVTMAWHDEATDLWCLARPDTINFDGTVTDYKKMSGGGMPFTHRLVDRRITDFGYDMQLAFAAEGFERLTGSWPAMAAIIAQSDRPPHHVILREIAEDDLRLGQWRNRRALRRFRACLDSGHWPGPGEDTGAYVRPEWQREQILSLMASEGMSP
jgi:hypothetical protein